MSFLKTTKNKTFEIKNMKIELVKGKWQMKGKMYADLKRFEKRIFRRLLRKILNKSK